MQENINIPDSEITTNLSFRQLVLMNMQQLTNFPYIEKDFDALTDYELLCLVVKFLNDVISNQNEQNASITRMYESFLALQTYVNNTKDSLEDAFNNLDNYVRNYFDNLDVQEEINNKLDQMLEDGVLEQIIEQFLQSTALWCFNTVADMKLATNLINGSFANTFGYYSVNDGGDAKYKIRTKTNDDTIDESTIIALNDNTLIAELIIKDEMCLNAFGCYGDNTHDDTSKFQIALNKSYNLKLNENKNYKITETLTVRNNTKLIGSGLTSKITSYIDDGTSIFYNNDLVMHFIFKDFYINANNKNCYGFIFTNPYDNCVFDNIYFDNFTKACLYLGTNERISQTLLINNCCVYMSATAELNTPIFDLTKCYESNILNNKLLNRQDNYNDAPCLLLTNVFDNNIQGNSFTCSHDCGIKITGDACRHNRIISNTYEGIDGDYSIKLIGLTSDAILHTLILEAFTYYSAPDKIYCENESNGFFVGMESTGGRRNIVINVNDIKAKSPYGNTIVTTDDACFTASGFGIMDYDKIQRFKIKSNSSESVDYGLELQDDKTKKKLTMNFPHSWLGLDKPGFRIKLISPDGNTTKYLGINDNGEITLYSYPI